MTLTSRLIMASGSVRGSETYTTPGTYYWTAPAGVTKVDVTGQGGSKSALIPSWNGLSPPTVSIVSSCSHSSSLGGSLSYESLYSDHVAAVNAANTVTTNSSGASYSNIPATALRLWCSTTSLWGLGSVFGYTQSYTGTLRRTGTIVPSSTLANMSGTIPTSPLPSTRNYTATTHQLQRYNPYYNYGGNTTSFGKTFPDDSGQATYTEVPVVADTQYTIVVGTDLSSDTAFLNFDYY